MRQRTRIRGKIAAVILICMIPVLVLALVLSTERNADRRNTVVRTQEDLARALAEDVNTFFATAVHTERVAGAAVTAQPYPVSGIAQLFAAIRHGEPGFLRLVFADPEGRVEAGDPPSPPRARLNDQAFEEVRAGAPWAVGSPRMFAGRPVVDVAAAIMNGGSRAAIVDGVVDLTLLPASAPTAATPAADAVVLDGAGPIVFDLRAGARPAEALRAVPAVAAALHGRIGYIDAYADPTEHTRDIGAAVPISSLGWAAVVLVPESSAYEPVRRETLTEAIWLIAYVILGLGLAWVLGGELSAPIQALARAAARVGRGEVGYRVPVRRTDELGDLAAAFNEMSAQLERSVAEMSAVQAVSDVALSTVRLDELLPPLVQRIVAALGGDGGAIWFVDDTTGELIVPEAFGGIPGTTRRLASGEGLAGRTAQGYRAVQMVDAEALRAVDPDIAAHGVQAALSVPLRAGGQTIGVMQVFSRSPREFGPAEIRLVETFADRVALAVSNARTYQRQQEIGRIIQHALMPAPSVRLPGVAVAGRYQPSREVGGDFYAVLPFADGRVGLAIADVAGKGIPAATLAARTRYLLEALALDGRDPADVLLRLNAALERDSATSLFVSLFYGVLAPADTGPAARTFRFASAGHVPPVLLRAEASQATLLDVPGLLLGILPEARYVSHETSVGPGDLIALYTDGLTEARRSDGELFGEPRLTAVVTAARDGTAEDIADEVMRAVADWAGAGPRDDRALAVMRLLPVEAQAAAEPSGRTTTVAP
ncbi:MAG TPA: SpoIIE family protein phosphatase [bacterium]|nr:SpoIIE family protein phosphatase [bacterium]